MNMKTIQAVISAGLLCAAIGLLALALATDRAEERIEALADEIDAVERQVAYLEQQLADTELPAAPIIERVETHTGAAHDAPNRAPAAEFTEAEPTPETLPSFTAYEAELIGRTIWGEAGGVKSEAERAAVAWCILNRVDAWGISIEEAVTQPRQFHGYRYWGECPQEHIDLAADVLNRWDAEKRGETNVGRVLPADYLYFVGDGDRNHFSIDYKGTDYWGWSLVDPYK